MTDGISWNDSFAAVLNLTDSAAEIYNVQTDNEKVILSIRKKSAIVFCPNCSSRMHSKGIRHRKVCHPMLQDGRSLMLDMLTRKWHCPLCGCYTADQYPFVEKQKRVSTITELLILDKMKDLGRTCTSIAADMHVSDTYVHDIFTKWVDLPRLPLCRVLLIDEVYLKTDRNNLYSVVLMNWETGDIIDILPNRYQETINRYFNNIPKEERDVVEYVVSDMYDTYSSLAGTKFRNAVSVIDCFHHTQPLISGIITYINRVKKRYRDKDNERREQLAKEGKERYFRRSRECYVLDKFSWLITKNSRDISYEEKWVTPKNRAGFYYRPRDLEAELYTLDPNFKKIHELKEMYVEFTADPANRNNRERAAEELDGLISLYKNCGIDLFKKFASTLEKHRGGIINSFLYLTAERSDGNNEILRRISTGPLESFNNNPKDYKRNSNGVSNFSFTRNRLLWACRKDPPILGVPKTPQERHTAGKERGSYKKKKKDGQ